MGAGWAAPGAWGRDGNPDPGLRGSRLRDAGESVLGGPRSSSTSRHLSPCTGWGVPVLGGGGCGRTLTQPRGRGRDSHPPPLPTHRLLTTGPSGRSRPRAAPRPLASRAAPLPHLRGPGSEGARQLGVWGGLCLPDSPVETAGVGGEGGAGAPRAGCCPSAAPPPLSAPSPPAVGTGGVGEGARWKRQGHSPCPLGPGLPRWFQLSAQEFNPGRGVQGTQGILPQNSWAHLRAGPVRARGPDWISPHSRLPMTPP